MALPSQPLNSLLKKTRSFLHLEVLRVPVIPADCWIHSRGQRERFIFVITLCHLFMRSVAASVQQIKFYKEETRNN